MWKGSITHLVQESPEEIAFLLESLRPVGSLDMGSSLRVKVLETCIDISSKANKYTINTEQTHLNHPGRKFKGGPKFTMFI